MFQADLVRYQETIMVTDRNPRVRVGQKEIEVFSLFWGSNSNRVKEMHIA